MSWMRRSGLYPLVGLAGLVSLTGLTACRTVTNEKSVDAVQYGMLPGIPVPEGFSVVPEHSAGRSSGQVRYGKYEYVGRLAPASLNRWYKDYMTKAGFKLLDERIESGVYTMLYSNEQELCDIRIKPGTFKRTILDIDVGPPPAAAPQKDATPDSRRKAPNP